MSLRIELSNLDLAQFEDCVQSWFFRIQPGSVVLLKGPVGVGKTHFVKTGLRILAIPEVVSPTYAFHSFYPHEKFNIHHLDLYRVDSLEDLESLGFWDLFADEKSVILVEWPEHLFGLEIPHTFHCWEVNIDFGKDALRDIRIVKV